MQRKFSEMSIACGVYILLLFFSAQGLPGMEQKFIKTCTGGAVYLAGLCFFYYKMKSNELFKWPLLVFSALLGLAVLVVLFRHM